MRPSALRPPRRRPLLFPLLQPCHALPRASLGGMKVYARRCGCPGVERQWRHGGRGQEVVLMVGIAGSGKTTLARSKYAGHAHVSLDVIKKNRHQKYELIREYGSRGYAGGSLSVNRKAEYVMIEDALAAGRDVVVDDTNLTAEIRAVHVEHARMHGAEVHAVHFDNAVRAYRRNAARAAGRVPHHVVVMQRAALEPPEILEGFASIHHIY